MTVGQHIANLRVEIGNRLGMTDDEIYTDEVLYSRLNLAAAIVISRIAKSFNKLNDFLWTRWPVPLVVTNNDLFICESFEHCTVLESTWAIPLPLTGRNKMHFKVFAGQQEIVPGHPSVTQFDPIKAGKPTYEFVNQKLRIYGNKVLKGVEVKGIFLDPISWKDHNYCGTEEYDCLDLNEEFYPLTTPEYQSMAYNIVLQGLGMSLQEPAKNDSH